MNGPILVLLMGAVGCALAAPLLTADDDALQSLQLDWLNPAISPQQDFYHYANGGWQAHHPIPPEYPSWGSFAVLQEKNQIAIHTMLLHISQQKESKPGSLAQKVGDFYFAGMDEARINKEGIRPLAQELARIDALQSAADLEAEIAHLHRYGINCGFAFGSMQDFKDSSKMIGAFLQAGLSLPDRDYYLKADQKFQAIRQAFLAHISAILQLAGDKPADANRAAQTVLALETALAQASLSQIAQRDPHAIYHPMRLAQLAEISPHFAWSSYLAEMGQPTLQEVNVAMPDFMRGFDKLLATTSLADWQIYLRWQVLDNLAPFLAEDFVRENFKMHALLTGTQALPPRWKQVIATESSILGFAIGELYVADHFSPAAKQQVLAMIAEIRKVLRSDLAHLQWMTAKTRRAALKKLDKMEERVGYPDHWWDYSSLAIDRTSYVGNVLRGMAFLVQRDLHKIGKPIDRSEWAMTPQTVNAYYDPSMNSINIPMGILQPPYFDPTAPLAVNYGGIGVVIGHEITHGFDDEGAQFDAYGNLHNWWTPADLHQFRAATQCIVQQFSQYTVNKGIPVQGALVVGEATADLGGVMLAYRALHAADDYAEQPAIHGFTPEQQFFLSFAHIWANNIRPEYAHHLILVDPHPPAQYRVNGTLANVPEFKKLFHIPIASPMVNPAPCVIW